MDYKLQAFTNTKHTILRNPAMMILISIYLSAKYTG